MSLSSELATRHLTAFFIELFKDPSRINLRDSMRRVGELSMRVHRHAEVFQLNFFNGCAGEAMVNGRSVSLRGSAVMAFYPGDPHGYELRPGPGSLGEVLMMKLRVESAWPAIRQRIFAAAASPVPGELMLLRALRRATGLSAAGQGAGPIHAARVAEVLCLWPGAAQSFPVESAASEPELDAPMRAVLAAIDARAIPPAVDELAHLAGLSPRHFARRFRQAIGVAPRAFIETRRLQRAKGYLLQGDMNAVEVADALGFGSLSAFSRWFTRHTGVSPSRFREGSG
jgi:AraC family transcriptional regulator